MLVPEATEEDARTVADDPLARIRTHPATVAGHGRRIGCSVGIACFDNDAAYTPEGLISAADAAVQYAKQSGGDRVVRARASRGTGMAICS